METTDLLMDTGADRSYTANRLINQQVKVHTSTKGSDVVPDGDTRGQKQPP